MPLTLVGGDVQRGPSWTTQSMIGAKNRLFGITATPLSGAWASANLAVLVPFVVAVPTTFTDIFFQAGTTPGTANYDLGIYTDTFTQIISLGATAAVNTTDAILPVGGGAFPSPLTLARGRYYIAMSAAATSITARGIAMTNGTARAFGVLSAATSHPLPTTITPAVAGNFVPTLGLTTITNLL